VGSSNPKSEAAACFEAYLSDHAIDSEYEPDWRARFEVGGASNPDFLVDPASVSAICEVAGAPQSQGSAPALRPQQH
jgi:hypothetical protein